MCKLIKKWCINCFPFNRFDRFRLYSGSLLKMTWLCTHLCFLCHHSIALSYKKKKTTLFFIFEICNNCQNFGKGINPRLKLCPGPSCISNYKAGSSVSTAHVCLFKNSAAKAAFCPYSRRGRKMLNKLFQVLVLPDSHWPLYTTSLWGRAPGSSWCGDVVCWEVRMTVNIYELPALFSSLGELAFDEADVDEDDEEEEEKSLSAESWVEFCPVRLSLHTGHVSCCWQQ